jgi:transcriptional regulator with XRE-family HTH domain
MFLGAFIDWDALGISIRRKRCAKGLSQGQLARLTGLTKGHISNMERGKFKPSIESLVSLSEQLDEGSLDLLHDIIKRPSE